MGARKPCGAQQRTAGLFSFLPSKEGAMPALKSANTQPARPTQTIQPSLKELAEGVLRRNSYLALKNVTCDMLDGVLVLRGCLPTYYLKQVAQEAVAPLKGVERIDNQIQVVTPACTARQG
jgi:hypothetical protein